MPHKPNSPYKAIIVNTPEELGKLARAKRMALGVSLRKTAASNNLGARFLSEFERGKPTSEIGKVITALHAAGFDLAVVPKSPPPQATIANETTLKSSNRLSQQLHLEFPYDWSNPQINESTFIRLVLEKTRFNDILRVAHHFSIERLESEAEKLADLPQATIINKLLARVRAGIARARNST